MKRRSASLAAHFKTNDGRMAISDVTLFELARGAENYDEPQARLTVIDSFAARLELLPFDSRAALQSGQIRARLERDGQMIGAYNVMIAAISRSQGLVLVTNNIREFERVEGMRIEQWG